MSIFSGGKKWGNRAKQVRAYAQQAEEELEDYNFGRDLLTNIRRQRIAASQLRMMEGGFSDIQTTAYQGQMANVNSGLASDYGYSAFMSKESERIQRMYDTAASYEKKAAKLDKRANIAGMAVAAPVALATTVMTGGALAPVWGAAAGAATTGIISATGGGRAAVAGSVQGTILGTSTGYTLSNVGTGLGASSAGKATGAITESGGTFSSYAVNGVTQATSATESAITSSAITYTPNAALSLKDYATLATSLGNTANDFYRMATRENVFTSRGYK